jgi:hypothetical protein
LAFALHGELVTAAVDGEEMHAIPVGSGAVYATPAWSPDGRRIAVITNSGTIEIVRLDNEPSLRVTPVRPIDTETTMSWSPDSAHLLYSEAEPLNTGYGAYDIDVSTGAQRLVAPFGADAIYSHDGANIAFGGLQSIKDPPPVPSCVGVGIWIIPSSGGRPLRETGHCNRPPFTISVSATASVVYGEVGSLNGILLPGYGTVVRGVTHPCGRRPSRYRVTPAVGGSWSRRIAPRETTIYGAASTVERTHTETIVSPRVILRQIDARLVFELSVVAARSFVGHAARVEVDGTIVKRVVLRRATRRNGSVTTTAKFRLPRKDVRIWLQSMRIVLPKKKTGPCLAPGISNELAVSR